MGFAICTGRCIGCGRLFSFNPLTVPSSSAITGDREPICSSCIERINTKRVAGGMPAFPVPSDAYEACDEADL